ncbi:MAG: NADH:ubiquinone reductase (Na(+)-transporting) subunit C [Candidatus Omnitrophota bacterium]
MRRQDNSYTIVFALVVCALCSLSLAIVTESFKARREINEGFEIKRNILKAVHLKEPLPARAPQETIIKIYEEKISGVVIDREGNILPGRIPGEEGKGKEGLPLYIYQEGNDVAAYCFPVEGKGLWSTLYGYLAIEPDGMTIRGITFYKHKETPGLGGEIEREWFQEKFRGKRFWDTASRRQVQVLLIKGKVSEKMPEEQRPFYVDGISGATMTSNGVSSLINNGLQTYEPFLKKIRSY